MVDALEPIEPLKRVSVNDLSDRAVYDVGGHVFAKLYTPGSCQRFRRERLALELASAHARAPAVIHAEYDSALGGLIITERAKGMLLDELYRNLDAIEYQRLVYDLGVGLGTLHALRVDDLDSLPQNELEAARRMDFERQERALAQLLEADVIESKTSEVIRKFSQEQRVRRFHSPIGFLHGDAHNENIFVDRDGQGFHCTFIDFEDAAPGYTELDWVHPALNILGEGFAMRRLSAAGMEITESFCQGYASVVGASPDLLVVADHALAWYLDKAAQALGEERRAGFFVATAIGCFAQATGMDFNELCPPWPPR